MRYLVAIPIPEPWRSVLIDIKHRFRPAGWHDTIDPHITLLAPDQPLLPFEEAAIAFRTSHIDIPAFSIQATSLGCFSRRGRHTLVLRPNPEDSISSLFQSVISASTWQQTVASTRRNFVSHITLANQLPAPAAESANLELSNLSLQVEFKCDTIALYAKQAKWPRWQELASKSLLNI